MASFNQMIQQGANAGRKQRALQNLQQGTYGTTGERIQWSYFDTIALATGATTTRLFTVPLGSAGKTLADTNLTQSSQIPQGQNFSIHALKAIFTPHAAFSAASYLAFANFLRTTVVEFVIGNKAPMFQVTLAELLGASVNGAVEGVAATGTLAVGQAGFLTGIYPLNVPLHLAALTPFEVKLTYTTAVVAALNTDVLEISLVGRLLRAI